MPYRAAAEPSGDAEASALGAYHRRLLRLRLSVVVPTLFVAALIAAAVAAKGFTIGIASTWCIGALGWGMVGAIVGSFTLVLLSGWLLYRGLLRWWSARWLPRLARWYGIPRDLLEKRALPFQEGSRLDPRARRELHWRMAIAGVVGLIAAIAVSSAGSWLMTLQ